MPELDLNKLTTIEQLETTSNAILDKVKAKGYALDSDLAAVAKSGDADDVSYDNTASGLTATDVQTAIDEVAAASAGGVDSKTVYMTDASSGQTAFAKVYKIYQGANGSTALPDESELLGTINVPKDMVVEAASLEYVETADEPYEGAAVGDPYIDLTIANAASDHIYIPVKDLVDVYTAGNGLTLANGQFSVVINSSSANGLSVTANGIELALATTTTAGAMSAADKAKLDAADVTAYTAGNGIDVTNHEISATVVAANGLSVGTDGIALAAATQSAAGAMSAADKAKLDGADVTAYTGSGAISVTNHEITVSAATPSTSGVGGTAGTMSAADKEKLDSYGVATDAEITTMIAGLHDL